jgi:membrane protease YdiL (CAAX protease family)
MSKKLHPLLLVFISLIIYFSLIMIEIITYNFNNVALEFILDDLSLALCLIILSYLLKKLGYEKNILSYLIKPKSITFLFFLSVALTIIIILINRFIMIPLNNLIIPKINFFSEINYYMYHNMNDSGIYFIIFLSVVFISPILEEFYFRGFCYTTLRTRYNKVLSLIITSSVFVILHPTPQLIFIAIFLNIILCTVFELTENILSPILIHIFYNAYAFFFVPNS